MAYGTSSWTIFLDWYESISSDAVVRSDGRVDGVMMYRDIELAIDHAPEVAAPWALMVQYLPPFKADTAKDIWDGFTRRFLVEGRSGAHIEVAPRSGIEEIRTTCLATWLAAEVGDHRHHDALLNWVNRSYEPRQDEGTGEFAYWFHLNEPHPRGQWNNAIMNTFVAPPGTWTSILSPAP